MPLIHIQRALSSRGPFQVLKGSSQVFRGPSQALRGLFQALRGPVQASQAFRLPFEVFRGSSKMLIRPLKYSEDPFKYSEGSFSSGPKTISPSLAGGAYWLDLAHWPEGPTDTKEGHDPSALPLVGYNPASQCLTPSIGHALHCYFPHAVWGQHPVCCQFGHLLPCSHHYHG